ncbi:MAG: ABC transporter ATP-binding protein [Deltaproteobacteria bacterium]|nr:ABC transporter ATP-binding protein [Deltaproteobacteria bacterium]
MVTASAYAIQCENLTVLRDKRPVLHALTLAVPARGVTALLGPNGAGKSTLFAALLGLITPHQGVISLFDQPWTKSLVRERVGVLLQDEGAFEAMTVREYAALFATLGGEPARATQMLANAGISARERAPLRTLSGGELRRLQLETAVAFEPSLLLLDEPTNHLDPTARRTVLTRIAALGARAAVVMATHDLAEAERIADTVLVLVQGRLVHSGSARASVASLPDHVKSRDFHGLFAHYAGAALSRDGRLDEPRSEVVS